MIETTYNVRQLEDIGIALGDVPLPGPWAARGRCRTAPLNLFFPGRGEPNDQAKKLCQGCPVINECRSFALAYPDLHGVWGGLSVKERKHERAALPAPTPIHDSEPARSGTRSANGALHQALVDLTDHPGRWARVAHYHSPESAGAVASLLRTGTKPAPPGHWTFEARRNAGGGSDLYARYDGQEKA